MNSVGKWLRLRAWLKAPEYVAKLEIIDNIFIQHYIYYMLCGIGMMGYFIIILIPNFTQ